MTPVVHLYPSATSCIGPFKLKALQSRFPADSPELSASVSQPPVNPDEPTAPSSPAEARGMKHDALINRNTIIVDYQLTSINQTLDMHHTLQKNSKSSTDVF